MHLHAQRAAALEVLPGGPGELHGAPHPLPDVLLPGVAAGIDDCLLPARPRDVLDGCGGRTPLGARGRALEGPETHAARQLLQVAIHPAVGPGRQLRGDSLPVRQVHVVDDDVGVGDALAVVVVVEDRHLIVAEVPLGPGGGEAAKGREVDAVPGIGGDDEVLEGTQPPLRGMDVGPVRPEDPAGIVHLPPDLAACIVDLGAVDEVGTQGPPIPRQVRDAAPDRSRAARLSLELGHGATPCRS